VAKEHKSAGRDFIDAGSGSIVQTGDRSVAQTGGSSTAQSGDEPSSKTTIHSPAENAAPESKLMKGLRAGAFVIGVGVLVCTGVGAIGLAAGLPVGIVLMGGSAGTSPAVRKALGGGEGG